MKQPKKLFVIKKYVMASSAIEAIKKEGKIMADDVWIDEDWKRSQKEQSPLSIGFNKE